MGVPKGGPTALLTAAILAGCAQPPAWFVERSAQLNREGYPRLANVPSRVDANVNQAHWDSVRNELDAASAELRASPRSEPPRSPDSQSAAADAFEQNARADIEATRLKH
jgi:hypothetical protein